MISIISITQTIRDTLTYKNLLKQCKDVPEADFLYKEIFYKGINNVDHYIHHVMNIEDGGSLSKKMKLFAITVGLLSIDTLAEVPDFIVRNTIIGYPQFVSKSDPVSGDKLTIKEYEEQLLGITHE